MEQNSRYCAKLYGKTYGVYGFLEPFKPRGFSHLCVWVLGSEEAASFSETRYTSTYFGIQTPRIAAVIF